MSNTENGNQNVAELTNEQMEKILAVAKENNIDVTAEQMAQSQILWDLGFLS